MAVDGSALVGLRGLACLHVMVSDNANVPLKPKLNGKQSNEK